MQDGCCPSSKAAQVGAVWSLFPVAAPAQPSLAEPVSGRGWDEVLVLRTPREQRLQAELRASPPHTPGQEPLQPLRQGRHTKLPANTGLKCSPRKPELGAWGSMAGLWGIHGVRECRGQGRFPREFLVLQTPPGGSVLAGGAAGQGCPSVFGCVR